MTTILISEFFTPVFAHQAPETPPFWLYLQQVSLKEMDNRRLSAKLSETTAVKRSIYPQALFGALVENSDYQPQRVIEMIDLKDDFLLTVRSMCICSTRSLTIIFCWWWQTSMASRTGAQVQRRCATAADLFPSQYSRSQHRRNGLAGQLSVYGLFPAAHWRPRRA
ncbi:hypothetical protein CWS02_14725 [Enterobacter sp. EA-1]|nr:hypothetical protein CWS02_14725 [Enterobacter sp. EA-1]